MNDVSVFYIRIYCILYDTTNLEGLRIAVIQPSLANLAKHVHVLSSRLQPTLCTPYVGNDRLPQGVTRLHKYGHEQA